MMNFGSTFVLIFLLSSHGPARAEEDATNFIVESNTPSNEDRAREQKAQKLFEEKKFDEVIVTLNPYTEQLSVSSYLLLSGSYSEKKLYAEEVRVLKMVAEKDPDNHEVHYILASAYYKLSNSTEDTFRKKEIENSCIQSLRDSIRLNKKYQPPYNLLINIFVANKNHYEARTLLGDMIKLFGNRPPYMNDLCRLLSLDGYLQQAIDDCRRAIIASKNYPDNYIYLAQAYFDKGDEKQSEKILITAAKRFPNSEPVQWAAAEFYQKKKNYSVANKYLGAAIKADPKSVRSNVGYANTLLEVGKPEEALPYFASACQLDPNTKSAIATAAAKLRIAKKESLAKKFLSTKLNCQSQ